MTSVLAVLDGDGVRHQIADKPSKNNVGETLCGEPFVWASSGGVIWHMMEGTARPTRVMHGSPNHVTCLECLGRA